MRELPLLNGGFALVDDADYEPMLAIGGWYAKTSAKSLQVVRDATTPDGKKTTLWSLKRTLMGNPEGMYVRFKDGNQLNNQRDNLIVMTPEESQRFRVKVVPPPRDLIKKPKKVVKYDRKRKQYVARVRVNKRYKIIGRFKTKPEAQQCYNEYMKQLGEHTQCPTTKSE